MDFLNRQIRLRTQAEEEIRRKVKGKKVPLPPTLDITIEDSDPILSLDEKALYGESGEAYLYMDLECHDLMQIADAL